MQYGALIRLGTCSTVELEKSTQDKKKGAAKLPSLLLACTLPQVLANY